MPETLVAALDRLEAGVQRFLKAPDFVAELNDQLTTWAGRPTALTHAHTLSKRWGADIWLKREDLAHTGAHKINNAIGQALAREAPGREAHRGRNRRRSARRCECRGLRASRIAVHGLHGLDRHGAPGAERRPHAPARRESRAGHERRQDAARRDRRGAARLGRRIPDGTYYLLGSAVGPHPYPYLVRELQSVIGREARAQSLAQLGSLAGRRYRLRRWRIELDRHVSSVRCATRASALLGIEAGGRGLALGDHCATLALGQPGVLQGSYSMLLQDEHGQIQETHSVSAGLDYPGVGPEHSLYQASGRVRYESASDEEALACVAELSAAEGILPALESAHALHGAKRWAAKNPGKRVVICLSGRGDKDMPTLQKTLLAGKI